MRPGVVDPPPRWLCFGKPPLVRADGCPGAPPLAGTACTASMTCSYGVDTTGECWGYTMGCTTGGTWIGIPQAPPP